MLVCTGCAKTVLITIRMRVAGREIVFHRCSKCEANTWQDDAGVLSLTEVLELARAGHERLSGRFRHRPPRRHEPG